MSRTTRVPNEFASQGGVRQHGGSLPLYRCNACGDEVVWVESKRTGRPYLCNVRRGHHDQRFYVGRDLHPRDCAERKAEQAAGWDALARHEDERHRYAPRPDCPICQREP